MRADQRISLLISGDPLLITCEDPSVIEAIRHQASAFETAPTPLLGFHIAVPTPTDRMWVLLGGNGVVLARARSAPPVVRSLSRWLSAMLSPQATSTSRLRVAAIVGDGASVLADPYLLAAQPVAERRYERRGLRILDSPYIDLADALHLAQTKPNVLTPTAADDGHIGSDRELGSAVCLLWRSTADATTPTPGQALHAIATTVVADSDAEKLRIAGLIAADLEIALVEPDVRGAVITAASQHLT